MRISQFRSSSLLIGTALLAIMSTACQNPGKVVTSPSAVAAPAQPATPQPEQGVA